MKLNSVLLSIIPVPVVALVLSSGCARHAAAPKTAAVAPAIPVQTARAVRRDVPRRVDAIGTVQALRSVSVKSQVDGIIAQIHFKEGDEVKVGDPLFTLDRRPFENAVLQARAALAGAKAQDAQAVADADRYAHLDRQSAISKEAYAQYLTKAESAKAAVQAGEASLANAELQLGYAEIRAPIAGRTGQLLLHEGALVKANDNSFALVTINQLSPIAVSYSVPERALDEIHEAQAAGKVSVVVTDRATGVRKEDGALEFVDNTIDPTTGMITLKAVFRNEDKALWPGRFVYVATETGVDRQAIVVPSTAVQNNQEGSTVYVLKPDHTVDLRTVRIDRTAGDDTLLSSGVNDGETVVTDGQLRLLPGMRAEPRELSGAPLKVADAGPETPGAPEARP